MKRSLGTVYIGLLLLLLLLPLVVVAGVSLNGGQALRFPPQDPSFRWYGELFRAADWTGPLRNSLLIAALAALIAVAVALPLALHVWGRGGWLARALTAICIPAAGTISWGSTPILPRGAKGGHQLPR